MRRTKAYGCGLVCTVALAVAMLPDSSAAENEAANSGAESLEGAGWSEWEPDRRETAPPPGAVFADGSSQFWHPRGFWFIGLGPDGRTLSTLARDELFVWEVPTGKLRSRTTLRGMLSGSYLSAVSRDMSLMATSMGLSDARGVRTAVQLWDLKAGRLLHTLRGSPHFGGSVHFSPNGKWLATAESPNIVRLWSVAEGRQVRQFTVAGESIQHLTFADDATLVGITYPRVLRHWSVASGEQTKSFTLPRRYLSAVYFSPDAKYLALIDQPNRERREAQPGRQVLDVNTGQPVAMGEAEFKTIFRQTSKPGHLSADGRIVAVERGHQIELWDEATGRRLSDPRIRTFLRPTVAATAEGDPLQVVLHWLLPRNDRERNRVSPPFNGNYSPSKTINSLTFYVTAPDGKKHELRARAVPEEKGDDEEKQRRYPLLAESTTLTFLFDQEKLIASSFGLGRIEAPWVGEAPSFDQPGDYRILVSGSIVVEPHAPVPFRSAETIVSRGKKGYLPLDAIRQRALEKLQSLLPESDRAVIKPDESYSATTIDAVNNLRLVRFTAPGQGWSERLFRVRVLPDGRVADVFTTTRFTCVAQGTLVECPTGPRPIEALRVGDVVWGFDLAAGRRIETTIRHIRRGQAAETLRFVGGLRVTPEHPIWARGTWKAAEAVQPTDPLLGFDGQLRPAGRVERETGAATVFDLTTDEPHNFFAGGRLVHNKSVGYSPGSFDPWRVFYEVGDHTGPSGLKRLWVAPDLIPVWWPDAAKLSFADVGLDDAGLAHVAGLKVLRSLDLSGCPISDAGLRPLSRLEGLEELNLSKTSLRGPGLEHLSRLRKLKSLDLAHAAVTGEALRHLRQLKSLSHLRLSATPADDAGLSHLAGLEALETLQLDGTQAGDAGLAHLRALARLQQLDLTATTVRGEGLAHIASLPRLRALQLGRTRVGDAGLRHLAVAASLETLGLAETDVTSRGLRPLERLARLQELDLHGTRVDDGGLYYLRHLRQLKSLDLMHSQATGDGLKYVPWLLEPWSDGLRIAPLRIGNRWLDVLASYGPVSASLADVIARHSAEVFAYEQLITGTSGHKRVYVRPLWAIAAEQALGSKFGQLCEREKAWGEGHQPYWHRGFERVVRIENVPHRLDYLHSFQHLEEVTFDGWSEPTHDADLAPFERVRLPIRALRLPYASVTTGAFDHLVHLQDLEELDLSGTDVDLRGAGAAAIAKLAALSRLRKINLSRTSIDDRTLAELARLRGLESLNLSHPSEDGVLTDAGIAHLRALADLRELDLSGADISAAGLEHLRSLKKLESLSIAPERGADLADDGLAQLEPLTELRKLSILARGATPEGIQRLARLAKLEELEVRGPALGNQELRALSRCTRLTKLDVNLAGVDDDGLERLAPLRRLRSLNLSGARISNEGLRALAALPWLESLTLRRTEINSHGLVHLTSLKWLVHLDLADTSISTSALEHLRQMPRLKTLNLNSAQLTALGRETLKKELPSVVIRGH